MSEKKKKIKSVSRDKIISSKSIKNTLWSINSAGELALKSLSSNHEIKSLIGKLRQFISMEKNLKTKSGSISVPRFGLLSLIAKRTPFHVIDDDVAWKFFHCKSAFTTGSGVFFTETFAQELMNEAKSSTTTKTNGLEFLTLHELFHIIREHVQRFHNLPNGVTNYATDMVINLLLQKDFTKLNPGPKLSNFGIGFNPDDEEKYGGKSEEKLIFDLLRSIENQREELEKELQKSHENGYNHGEERGDSDPNSDPNSDPGDGSGDDSNDSSDNDSSNTNNAGNEAGNNSDGDSADGGEFNQSSVRKPNGNYEKRRSISGIPDDFLDELTQSAGEMGEESALDGEAYEKPTLEEILAHSRDNHEVTEKELADVCSDGLADDLGITKDSCDEELSRKDREFKLKRDMDHQKRINQEMSENGYDGCGGHVDQYAQWSVKADAESEISWEGEIKSVIEGDGMQSRHSFDDPGPLYFANGTYLGGMVPVEPEDITIVMVDTSASVGRKLSEKFVRIILDLVAEESVGHIELRSADTVLRGDPITEFGDIDFPDENQAVELSGGGGTDMIYVLQEVLQDEKYLSRKDKIRRIIMLTDFGCEMELSWLPEDAPDIYFVGPGHELNDYFANGCKGRATIIKMNGIEKKVNLEEGTIERASPGL